MNSSLSVLSPAVIAFLCYNLHPLHFVKVQRTRQHIGFRCQVLISMLCVVPEVQVQSQGILNALVGELPDDIPMVTDVFVHVSHSFQLQNEFIEARGMWNHVGLG